jgi:cardiolipin synthase A/B
VLIDVLSLDWITLHGWMVMLCLAIYAIVSHTFKQHRHPSASMAWVVSFVLVPYVALPLYFLFGSRKVVAYRPEFIAPALPGPVLENNRRVSQAGQLARALGLGEPAAFEQLQIHADGQAALQALRDVITEARQQLDVCSFLLGRDALGDEMAERLIERAQQGVKVRLLLDGIGYYLGGRPDLERLKAGGVHVALFVSPLRSGLYARTNLRNHRKIVLADAHRLWCGGRNLAAEYFVSDPRRQRHKDVWIDLTFDLRGSLASQAQSCFDQDWRFATQRKMPVVKRQKKESMPALAGQAHWVASGPDQALDTIYTLLVSSCFTAQSRILLVTPYFVPDATLLMALTLAVRRGVLVELLMPERSNHRLADWARMPALRELLAAGAAVKFTNSMLHAKAVLIDNDLALVGSANLDERSLFLNYEAMVAFYEHSVVAQFDQWIALHQASAHPFRVQKPGLVRELAEGLVRWVAFQL